MAIDKVRDIEKVLIDIVDDLIQDWGIDLEDGVTRETTLVEHMEFASVDIIQLCVAIEEYYEKKIGFQDLLMEDGSYVDDLSVSQIAHFVSERV